MRNLINFIILVYLVLNIGTINCKNDIITLNSFRSDIKSVTDCVIKVNDMNPTAKTMVLVHQNNSDEETMTIMNDIAQVLADNAVPIMIIEEKDFYYVNYLYKGDILALLYFNDCKTLSNLNKTVIEEDTQYIFIISGELSEDNCLDKHEELKRIISIYDVTFVRSLDNGYGFETFIPEINEDTCKLETGQPILLNKCNSGFINSFNVTVFPDKNTLDFKRCPLNIGMGTLFPYALIQNKELLKDYDPVTELKGSDVELVKIVAEYLNSIPSFYYIYRKEENPQSDREFVKFLINGSLDLCAGGLYRIYGDAVAYSGIYNEQKVMWMYAAERLHRSWKNLVNKIDGLYIFFLFYICYAFIWSLFCMYDGQAVNLKDTLLYSWGALVGATSLQEPRSFKQKLLNMVYLIMCIHLSFYVSVQLYSFLTIQRPPEILRTNDEVMNSGRTAYLKPVTKYFVQDKKYEAFASKSEDCDSFLDCEMKVLAHNGLTVTIDGLLIPFQTQTAVDHEARILRATENILVVYHEMIVRKDSSIKKLLQIVVNRLFEAGICDKLYRDGIGISVVAKAKEASENVIHNSYACQAGCKITLGQAAGLFYLWLFGCFVASCIFAFELVFKKHELVV